MSAVTVVGVIVVVSECFYFGILKEFATLTSMNGVTLFEAGRSNYRHIKGVIMHVSLIKADLCAYAGMAESLDANVSSLDSSNFDCCGSLSGSNVVYKAYYRAVKICVCEVAFDLSVFGCCCETAYVNERSNVVSEHERPAVCNGFKGLFNVENNALIVACNSKVKCAESTLNNYGECEDLSGFGYFNLRSTGLNNNCSFRNSEVKAIACGTYVTVAAFIINVNVFNNVLRIVSTNEVLTVYKVVCIIVSCSRSYFLFAVSSIADYATQVGLTVFFAVNISGMLLILASSLGNVRGYLSSAVACNVRSNAVSNAVSGVGKIYVLSNVCIGILIVLGESNLEFEVFILCTKEIISFGSLVNGNVEIANVEEEEMILNFRISGEVKSELVEVCITVGILVRSNTGSCIVRFFLLVFCESTIGYISTGVTVAGKDIVEDSAFACVNSNAIVIAHLDVVINLRRVGSGCSPHIDDCSIGDVKSDVLVVYKIISAATMAEEDGCKCRMVVNNFAAGDCFVYNSVGVENAVCTLDNVIKVVNEVLFCSVGTGLGIISVKTCDELNVTVNNNVLHINVVPVSNKVECVVVSIDYRVVCGRTGDNAVDDYVRKNEVTVEDESATVSGKNDSIIAFCVRRNGNCLLGSNEFGCFVAAMYVVACKNYSTANLRKNGHCSVKRSNRGFFGKTCLKIAAAFLIEVNDSIFSSYGLAASRTGCAVDAFAAFEYKLVSASCFEPLVVVVSVCFYGSSLVSKCKIASCICSGGYCTGCIGTNLMSCIDVVRIAFFNCIVTDDVMGILDCLGIVSINENVESELTGRLCRLSVSYEVAIDISAFKEVNVRGSTLFAKTLTYVLRNGLELSKSDSTVNIKIYNGVFGLFRAGAVKAEEMSLKSIVTGSTYGEFTVVVKSSCGSIAVVSTDVVVATGTNGNVGRKL